MIRKIGWLAALSLFLLSSCTNDAGTNDIDKTEVETEESTEKADEANSLQNVFPQFFSYLSQQDSSFTVTRFEQSENTPLDSAKAFPLDKERLQPFSSFLIYNADSSLAIDLYSYNYVPVQRNGKFTLQRGEPDTEIGLIDTKANTRRRIFFSGPGTSIQQAKWENVNTVFLAGVEEAGPNTVRPLLLKINLSEKTMQVYNYNDKLQANMSNYVPEEALEKVNL